jgi:hypothetical protein
MSLKTVVDAVTGDWPVWKNQRSVSVATFVELSCAHAKLCAKLCEGVVAVHRPVAAGRT